MLLLLLLLLLLSSWKQPTALVHLQVATPPGECVLGILCREARVRERNQLQQTYGLVQEGSTKV